MLSSAKVCSRQSLVFWLLFLSVFAFGMAACTQRADAPPPADPVPETGEEARLIVHSQHIEAAGVIIDDIIIREAGWVIIHADEDGSPGPVIGYHAVDAGRTLGVVVLIDTWQATETLHAALYYETGVPGEFDFTGPYEPVMSDGQPVIATFQVGGVAGATPIMPEQPEEPVVIVLTEMEFQPAQITVAPGTIVLWMNESGLAHTVTSDEAIFDSGRLQDGESFEFIFRAPGTYSYYCQFHGGPAGQGMSGIVIVSEP